MQFSCVEEQEFGVCEYAGNKKGRILIVSWFMCWQINWWYCESCPDKKKKGWMHWKEEVALRSTVEFLCRPQCFLTLPNTKQLSLEKGYFLFARKGWTFCWSGTESKFHIEPYCPPRRNGSIYLTCSLSTCFPVWEDPMETSIEWWNEKAVFISFYPHFFLLQWCSRCHGEPRTQQGGAKAP